jgi:hypothetical protein
MRPYEKNGFVTLSSEDLGHRALDVRFSKSRRP